MSIEVTPIVRTFTYSGILLPDVPGLSPREVRDLYSAQYPELVSAEVEAGEVANGRQDFTFRKAVGTKGRTDDKGQRFAALKAAVETEAKGVMAPSGKLARALTRPGTHARGSAWGAFVLRSLRDGGERHAARVLPTSDMLAPLP